MSDEQTDPPRGDEQIIAASDARVTGETPVVRALNDVPAEVLDELTTAFEKHAIDVPAKPVRQPETDAVVIDGYDLISDQELTHARRPPLVGENLVIEDSELTGPIAVDDDDPVVKGRGRFRLRRIAVRRAEGRRRLRIVTWVIAPLLVVALVLGVLASPIFGVRHVSIEGSKYVSQLTLGNAKKMVKGKSIFSVDLGAVEDFLKTDPWVRDAQAKRRFPSTVFIDIAERKPVAWYVGSDNQARVIDVEGRVITVLNGQPTAYTQISGVGPDLPAGSQVDDVYAAAAQVVSSLPPEVAPLMLNMGVTGGTDLLMTLRTGTVVTFGRPTDLRAKLVSLVLVLRRTDPKSLKGIDLSSGDPVLAGR